MTKFRLEIMLVLNIRAVRLGNSLSVVVMEAENLIPFKMEHTYVNEKHCIAYNCAELDLMTQKVPLHFFKPTEPHLSILKIRTPGQLTNNLPQNSLALLRPSSARSKMRIQGGSGQHRHSCKAKTFICQVSIGTNSYCNNKIYREGFFF